MRKLSRASSKLVSEYLDYALNVRRKFFPCDPKAEDELDSLAQDALIQAARKFRQDESTFKTYAYVCISNKIKDYYQAKKNQIYLRSNTYIPEDSKICYPPGSIASINQSVIQEVVNKLSNQQYKVYRLLVGLRGRAMKQNEISEKLNISRQRVNQQVFRIKEIIRIEITRRASCLGIAPEDFI